MAESAVSDTPTAEATSGPTLLADAVRRLQAARMNAFETNIVVRQLREQFDEAHKAEIEASADANRELADAESRLRALMVAAYEAQPADAKSKQLGPGLGIKVNRDVEYDSGKAFEWAKRHGLCLLFDAKQFEDLARDHPSVIGDGLATVKDRPTATISKDLSGWE